jgi:outer membrane protein insertion porin family
MKAGGGCLTILGGLLLFALPAAADVADHLGKTVTRVRLEIEGRPSSEASLVAVVETRAGAPLSMIDVRESVTHLISLGRFDNVVVHAIESGPGVDLLYELSPVHAVERIDFAGDTGAPGVDTGDLRRALVERFGSAPAARRAAEMAVVVEALLQERGYLRAQVTPRTETYHAPDRAAIVFALTAGPRARIGAIEVPEVDAVRRADLLDRLEIAPGLPYERDAIDARVERYVTDRRDDRYYEARLAVTPQRADDDRIVNLTVSYVPGPRVVVAFTGDALPGDQRDELVPIEAEGTADEDLLEDSSNRIVDFLRAQGYRDAAAPYTRQEANGELRITFDVQRGPLYRVAALEMSGNQSVPFADLAQLIGVREGEPFRAARLDTDIAAIENLYRRRGFAAVSVQSGVDVAKPAASTRSGDVPVVVRIIVTENAQSIVESVVFEGNRAIAADVLAEGLGLRTGEPFVAAQMAVDRDALQVKYADRGFHAATITTAPQFSADGSRADLTFRIAEGPQLFVDHVLIVGNERTRTQTIARELQLTAGEPLGLSAVSETQRRLAGLGLFRRVRLTQVSHGAESTRDLLVSVEEAPVGSIGYGPGLEVVPRIRTGADGVARPSVEVAPRGFFEIGRRNLFGKNRSINFFTSISLQSTEADGGGGEDGPVAPELSAFGFVEYRVLGTFREPQVFGTAADAVLTAVTEQQQRSSFNFARRAFGADVIRRLTDHVSVTGNYQIQRTELFDEQIEEADRLLIDRLFPQLRLSSFSSSIVRDSRDDLFDPGGGYYVSANAQVAGRRIGSEVGLLKTYLTAQLYRTLPRSRGTVFAGSARVGMATGFAREVERLDENGLPVTGPDGEPLIDVVKDLPASERFFAGGDTTVRGFALDQLGTPDTFDKDGFPLGGNAVVILNGELRVPVLGAVDAVGFLDAGNVYARTGGIDLGQMRSAVGFGVRYRSPVGPIRLDVGFKLNPRDIVPGHPEAPRAVHISLGQAF